MQTARCAQNILSYMRENKIFQGGHCISFPPYSCNYAKPKWFLSWRAGGIPNEPTHRKQIKLRDKHQSLFYPLSFPVMLCPALTSSLLPLTAADRYLEITFQPKSLADKPCTLTQSEHFSPIFTAIKNFYFVRISALMSS